MNIKELCPAEAIEHLETCMTAIQAIESLALKHDNNTMVMQLSIAAGMIAQAMALLGTSQNVITFTLGDKEMDMVVEWIEKDKKGKEEKSNTH